MPRIALITDSDASLPPAAAAAYGIVQVPILVQFGAETFATGVDIDDAAVFARVDHEGKLPTTSAPSPGAFQQAYQAAFDAGADAVLCFCVSSEVSASYAAACAARDLLPDRAVTVVDTRTLTLGQGFMVLAAAEAALDGAGMAEAVARAEAQRDCTYVYGALATLKYLAMSGRVGQVAAGVATLLNVKPIVTVRDGKLDMLERVRTRGRALERILELVEQARGAGPVQRLGVVHVNARSEAEALAAQVRNRLDYTSEVMLAELTPGLSVHTGAGLVGVALVACRP